MKPQLKTIIAILVGVIASGIFSSAQAATLSLTPVSSEIGVGEKMTVELRIDSEGVGFNAAQATIRFPKDTLEVTALNKTESALSFWLEEPQFSNSEGAISFTGGTPFGVSGGAVGILKIEFRAKGTGSGTLSFTEAAITASDGSGANILSRMNDAVITVVPQRIIPKVPEPQQKIPEPQQIVREVVPSGKLPLEPILKISLYPEEDRWYNSVAQFTASWDLPLDISGVSTAINKQPNFVVREKSEGLFNNKMFAALSDGISYLHVRFKNNIGWGPSAHHKIAVDTQPPLGFEVNILEGEKTDNPAPTFQFQSSDALSGLKEYQIRVGDGDFINLPAADFTGSFKLPLQAPGVKKVLVKAIDLAENSVEDSVEIEIFPIASPTITFVPRELFSENEQGLAAKGTALPDVNILLRVQRVLPEGKGEVVTEGTTIADDKGNWEFIFGNQLLRNGQYVVLAQSQDARGALSLTVESQNIQVKSKPIIQIGKFQLGMGGALIFLLVIIAGGFGGGAWFYKNRRKKLALRLLVVKTDMAKVFKLIQDDLEKLQQAIGTPTEADDEFVMKRLQENIKKMEGYLKKEIDKLG
ncbi:MAG: cohesin domain-containing protein [Patescibacteria group bacterium]|nr:cohesin domain-containing protein [Patescibacteria group bacterium]MDD5490888.1 cohesin domain-containing protein [Patescibacteria group bacterium]